MMRENLHAMLVLVAVLFVEAAQFCSGGNTSFSCIKREREALLKFKLCFNDSSHMLSSWKGNDCCEWRGVGCDKNSQHIVSLQLGRSIFEDQHRLYLINNVEEVASSLLKLRYLEHLDLSGNDFNNSLIPPSFGLMKQLRYLNLSHTQFGGRIVSELGNLTRLRVLDLSNNYDAGLKVGDDVKWISRFSSLQQLDMTGINLNLASSNLFQVLGMLPSLSWLSLSGCGLKNSHLPSCNHPLNFTFLGNIQHLDLSWNSFQSPILAFLQNMSSLTFLDLSSNQFGGNITEVFLSILRNTCHLKSLHLFCNNLEDHSKLESIDLSNNQLTGSIPDSIEQLSKLESIDLSRNQLSGIIPNSIGQLSKLESLDLSINQLSGRIPESIGQLSKLGSMDLSRNQLSGSIPDSIGQLSKLESIDLSINQLSGRIPESIGQLSKLGSMDLSSNQLSGSIPESIGQLSKLGSIDLSSNQLSGSIPDSIGQLSNLESMFLPDNQLSGSIPDSIGQLSELLSIDLSANQLSGSIPNNIGQLCKLESMYIYSNQLSGSIPDNIGQLSELLIIALSGNQLSGSIPNSIGQLSKLDSMYLSDNQLSGSIPDIIGQLFELLSIDLSGNQLSGSIPNSIRQLSKLERMYLYSNQLSGSIPDSIGQLSKLESLYLSGNQLSGSIPDSIGQLSELLSIDLSGNQLSGSIPNSIVQLSKLWIIDLSNNQLNGSILDCWRSDQALNVINLSFNNLSGLFPSTMGQLSFLLVLQLNNNNLYGELHMALESFTSLVILDLGENKFSGNLTWILEGKIGNHSLKILRLRKNLFSGYIPLDLCSFSQLQILDLADNNMIGKIPSCFEKFSMMVNATQLIHDMNDSYWYWVHLMEVVKGRNLEYTQKPLELESSIDLSSNKLVGTIPKELVFLKGLHNLNLSWNHLSGKIPENIGQMENLESLDFSQNDLSGTIPNSMSGLTKLSHLNLSYNNLLGPIPTGNQLQTLRDPTIYAGNPQLCGAPLLKKCSDDVLPPTTTNSKDSDEGALEKMWFYIVLMSGFAIGFWGVVGTLIFVKSWRYAYFQWVDDVKHWILVVIALKVALFKKMFNGNQDDQ